MNQVTDCKEAERTKVKIRKVVPWMVWDQLKRSAEKAVKEGCASTVDEAIVWFIATCAAKTERTQEEVLQQVLTERTVGFLIPHEYMCDDE